MLVEYFEYVLVRVAGRRGSCRSRTSGCRRRRRRTPRPRHRPASRRVALSVSSGCSIPRSPAKAQHPQSSGTVTLARGRAGEFEQVGVRSRAGARAGGVDHDALERLGDGDARQDVLGGEVDGVDESHRAVLRMRSRSPSRARARDPPSTTSCRRRSAERRDRMPSTERVHRAGDHVGVAVEDALGLPRGAAAQSADLVGSHQRDAGLGRERFEGDGDARSSFGRAEHGADAGLEVDGGHRSVG